ncbi:hypothetical protein Pmani_009062 [Petrolisthes manimaculis]|uniref:Uncharacterized protein n=1 Tax=Petrolisthes manimaculis TaxID=1843537 RepID=A0AAE1Q4C1_9EUCA|nr:hypothetical protein Pmani_009062 [Petrolisthes manimaculis]
MGKSREQEARLDWKARRGGGDRPGEEVVVVVVVGVGAVVRVGVGVERGGVMKEASRIDGDGGEEECRRDGGRFEERLLEMIVGEKDKRKELS